MSDLEPGLDSVTESMPSTDSLFEDLVSAGGTAQDGAATNLPAADKPVANNPIDSGTEELLDGPPSLDDLAQEGAEHQNADGEQPPVNDGVQPPPPPEVPEQPIITATTPEQALSQYESTTADADVAIDRKYGSQAGNNLQAQQAIQRQLQALKDGAVEVVVDPITEKETRKPRSYYPDELDKRDQLLKQLSNLESEGNEILRKVDYEKAVSKIQAWTQFAVNLKPELAPYRDTLAKMLASGEVVDNGNGVDMGELLLRTKYRHEQIHGAPAAAAPAPAAEPAKPTYTPEQIAQAQANRQKQAVRERGLGTISAGKGGGGAVNGARKAVKGEPAYLQGATPEAKAQLDKFAMALGED